MPSAIWCVQTSVKCKVFGKARAQEEKEGAGGPAQRSVQRSKGHPRTQEGMPLAPGWQVQASPRGLQVRPQGSRPGGDRLRLGPYQWADVQDRIRMPLPGAQRLVPSQAVFKFPHPRDKQWSECASRHEDRVHRTDPWTNSASTVPRYEGYIDK